MNLARMMTDPFFIEDRAGTRNGPFKTKFGSGTLMVFQSELNIAEGDRIIRPLPDGSERTYIVEGSSFSSGSRNIPGHYSIRISEQAAAPGAASSALTATRDCEGTSAQAADKGLHSIAASMQSLAQAIERADFPSEQKEAARKALHALIENPVVTAVLTGTAKIADRG